jgi:AraC family transcriptional regulator
MTYANGYTQRINLVLDYINTHISEDLPLARLAEVAGFSTFHFHRIFKTCMGENLNSFVVRQRLERAAALLRSSPQTSLTQIALDCGFDSLSDFSRTFKKHFGISPGRWDRKAALQDSKIRQAELGLMEYNTEQLSEIAEQAGYKVEIRPFPKTRIAYIRVFNAYQNPMRLLDAYDHLMDWAARTGAADGTLIGMSQDDLDVTPPDQCRYDICLTVDDYVRGDEVVSVRSLPACQIASIHCVGDINEVDRVWQMLFRHWLPRSSYLPDNLPAMEIYSRTPQEIGWDTYDLDCAIPVISF